jgi:hypothetical protein
MSENSSRKVLRNRPTVWLIIIGGLMLPVAVVGLPMLAEAIADADREVVAMSHMRGIAQSMIVYAGENQGTVSDVAVLEEMWLSNGVKSGDAWLFSDPRLPKRDLPVLTPGMTAAEKKKVLEEDCDFWLCDPGTWRDSPDASMILLYDKGKSGGRRLIAFGDGHAEIFTGGPAELRNVVEQQNAERRRLGLPLLPADLMGPPVGGESASAQSRGAPEAP